MNDIEILENFIRIYKELDKKTTDFYFNKGEIPIENIENLIARVKYYEKTILDKQVNNEYKKMWEEITELARKLEQENKELKEENQQQRHQFQKQEKIIDKMAEKMVEDKEWFYSEFDNYTKQDFIEYFKKEVEKDV